MSAKDKRGRKAKCTVCGVTKYPYSYKDSINRTLDNLGDGFVCSRCKRGSQ